MIPHDHRLHASIPLVAESIFLVANLLEASKYNKIEINVDYICVYSFALHIYKVY